MNSEIITLKNQIDESGYRLSQHAVESRILTIRGYQVILDRDLADFYGEETKRINQQANRNTNRFPPSFRFQLTEEEKNELVANCNRFENIKHSSSLPYAYTEQGVAMLSAVLHSHEAVEISIRIIESFVSMRHILLSNAQLFQRIDRLEYKQIEEEHKIDELFRIIDERAITPKQGIFFDGQIFDAYTFVSNLIKSAKNELLLIDNYVDETVLTMLNKREEGVSATIFTKSISKELQLDLDKHNLQYTPIVIIPFNKAHDRFLIVDDSIYHIGASLKDLGKKWFAFSLMHDINKQDLLTKLR